MARRQKEASHYGEDWRGLSSSLEDVRLQQQADADKYREYLQSARLVCLAWQVVGRIYSRHLYHSQGLGRQGLEHDKRDGDECCPAHFGAGDGRHWALSSGLPQDAPLRLFRQLPCHAWFRTCGTRVHLACGRREMEGERLDTLATLHSRSLRAHHHTL